MALADTADGVMMLGAYDWAQAQPERKFVYNIAITGMSVVVAFLIGGIEALGLIGDKLKLEGWFWDAVASLNEQLSTLGFVIVAVFALMALASIAIYKFAGLEARPIEREA
jgi:high-affinity nickel-transport protein